MCSSHNAGLCSLFGGSQNVKIIQKYLKISQLIERCLQGFGWDAQNKRTLGKPRHKWDDNIKLDLMETRIDGANWIRLAQDRV
jgi:hypothetical protein